MSATFNWRQTIGAPAGTSQDLGSSGNLVNFKTVDTIGTSDYSNFPVSAGQNSMEVWLQGHFSGSFQAIYDLRFWMSANFVGSSTGLTINCNSQQQAYSQPTTSGSSIATSTIGTSDPGTANVSYGGSLTSSIQSSVGNQWTDYIVLQLQTTVSAVAGDTGLCTLSLSYIET